MEHRRDFPGEGWRIRDPHDAAPGVTRFIDQTSLFLTLVGLTSLLVGGIGVANGVRAWLDARARTIATLRCLGAASGLVLAVCLIQVLGLAVCGIVIGLLFGAVAPIALNAWLSGVLPVSSSYRSTPRLYTSLRMSTSRALTSTCSGLMYSGVPIICANRV